MIYLENITADDLRQLLMEADEKPLHRVILTGINYKSGADHTTITERHNTHWV